MLLAYKCGYEGPKPGLSALATHQDKHLGRLQCLMHRLYSRPVKAEIGPAPQPLQVSGFALVESRYM